MQIYSNSDELEKIQNLSLNAPLGKFKLTITVRG